MNPSASGPYLRRTVPSSAAFYHKLVIVQLSANESLKNAKQPRSLSWDWPAAVLLLACVLLASGRLVVTQATDHLFLVSFLALLGCMAGLALGQSRFSGWLSSTFGLLYGMFFIPWQIGLAFFADQEWTTRLRNLVGRLVFAISQFASGENVEDPLLFVTAMAIVFWLLSLNAGFRFARSGELWGAVIPFGLAALVVQSYDPREQWRAWLLALFLLCVLLLLARLQLLKRRKVWESTQTYVPFELSGSLSTLAFTSAAILVLFAWATPALASSLNSAESFWSTITSPWRAVREELGRALFSLEGESFHTSNVFGERFIMGRGIPQSPEIIFTVQIIQQDQIPIRYYWRDRVYDHYEDGNWTGGYDELKVWSDANADQSDAQIGRSRTQFLFTVQDSTVLLHAASQPIALNRYAKFSFAPNDDGSQDLDALFAQSPVFAGESYDVEASLAVPTANQLGEAGLDYPDWVTERYLQLPVDISPQMQELAQTLTKDLSTPYDKAVAITNYLRAELEYADRMPIAPFNRDPIEWALFEQKQGFCNYYASADVLMLRSLGIPARLAVGYAHGERENIGGRVQYIVRARDAHAWPEVYFPDIGWVEFEPTANQDPLIRPLINPEVVDDLEHPIRPEEESPMPEALPPEGLTSDEFLAQEEARNFVPSMIFLAALLTVAAGFLWRRYRAEGGLALAALAERGLTRFDIQSPQILRRAARLSEMPTLTRAFMEINAALGWLGQQPKAGDTPEQRAASLAARLPTLSEEIHKLSHDYQSRLYSRSKVSRQERSLRAMSRIRWAARREQLRGWLKFIQKK